MARFTVYPSIATTSRRGRPPCARSEAIKLDCAAASSFSRRAGRLVEAQRHRGAHALRLEMLAELGFCKGIEN